ncbi:hypothetical protein BT96DRAFT_926907 [Gymnopus androsaceus JB14]|uniref:DUF7587 domain-containing protein n=1 Tax=Gymnopus androsaceus JB14 TaxID=1447944 RepID=A0A6A4GSL4_9AGAR|nr:hypothetical protein BT96DRAFT_926907 [Gymnopus androsaceus JB14]
MKHPAEDFDLSQLFSRLQIEEKESGIADPPKLLLYRAWGPNSWNQFDDSEGFVCGKHGVKADYEYTPADIEYHLHWGNRWYPTPFISTTASPQKACYSFGKYQSATRDGAGVYIAVIDGDKAERLGAKVLRMEKIAANKGVRLESRQRNVEEYVFVGRIPRSAIIVPKFPYKEFIALSFSKDKIWKAVESKYAQEHPSDTASGVIPRRDDEFNEDDASYNSEPDSYESDGYSLDSDGDSPSNIQDRHLPTRTQSAHFDRVLGLLGF